MFQIQKVDNKKIEDLIIKYKKNDKKYIYPLLEDTFSNKDLINAIKVILSGQMTMSDVTQQFEKKFAKFVNAKYAVMVNSGSSANLLATFASCNPTRKTRFKYGDEAIIPALCWPTSLWPLVQSGLKPVFVDPEVKSLNLDADKIISKITNKTKLIMLVHVLGNGTNVEKIRKISKKKKIILIEDTCESLGSKFKKKCLGTFGDFGTYSFYFSHQISSVEGGMVVCNSFSDYQILLAMRSHGWSRNIKVDKKIIKKYSNIDKRFLFINSGFNLRPTDINAAIGLSQLAEAKKFKKIRLLNRKKLIKNLSNSKNWNDQFSFFYNSKNIDPSYFGFPIFLNYDYQKKDKFIKYLEKKKIETRPIITGNFLNQPAIKIFNLNKENKIYKNANEIEKRGFFIGLYSKPLSKKLLDYLTECLMKFDNI